MTELELFTSAFVLVFLLGFQSQSVNGGHYRAAFLTSFGIGTAQMVMFKLAPTANWSQIVALISGGPFGIVASMWIHRKVMKKNAQAEVQEPRMQKTVR